MEQYSIRTTNNSEMDSHENRVIKNAIWLYFLLIIFEGALRKWVLPGLANPLLIIRDPVAIFILLKAFQKDLLKFDINIFIVVTIAVVGIFLAVFFGHGNIFVALYGARIWIIHFPLIFLIGKFFNRNDVVQIGKMVVYLAPFMTLLLFFQFYSPQSAWVNRGVGGDLSGAGFDGALGFYRPPGTFSFTNGNGMFFSLVAPFVFYFWLNREGLRRWILIVATISLIVAMPLSISRTLFFSVAVSSLFILVASFFKPKYMGSLLIIGVLVAAAFTLLGQADFFQTAIDAFTSRFENANESEGGLRGVLGDRYLGGMIGALTNENVLLPFFGLGIGMGTNVGSMLLTGTTTFLISEGEWGRLIGEMGPLLGFILILVRLGLCVRITHGAFKKMVAGDILAWSLLSFALINIPQGQWAQPTALGFGIVIGGFVLAASKD